MSKTRTSVPVTFICSLSGGPIDRGRVVQTLNEALHHGDQALLIDGSYGPAPVVPHDLKWGGAQVLRMPDVQLEVAYDLVAQRSAFEHLIFVGSGCSIARVDMDRLRSKLIEVSSGAVELSPFRSGQRITLDSRSVIGTTRDVLTAIGGFVWAATRARKGNAGLVGSGDAFEVFREEVRRSGWPVEQLRQQLMGRTAAGPIDNSADIDKDECVIPPSHRIPVELRAAVGPSSSATVDWFADLLPRGQLEALKRLLGSTPEGPPGPIENWNALFVARMLWRRGQGPFAAHLLERADLCEYGEIGEISEIFMMMTTAGHSVDELLTKLAHALPQLAAVIASQPVDQASGLLLDWWRADPGSDIVASAVLSMAPDLDLGDALRWHACFHGVIPANFSPLLAIAKDAGRPIADRVSAARHLQIEGPECLDAELVALENSICASGTEVTR